MKLTDKELEYFLSKSKPSIENWGSPVSTLRIPQPIGLKWVRYAAIVVIVLNIAFFIQQQNVTNTSSAEVTVLEEMNVSYDLYTMNYE